jgi:putative redox protein
MGSEGSMQVKVCQIEGVKFEIQARSHKIVCDQPAENGGTDSGMTPPELLLASLGSCAAFYAAEYLRTRKLAQSGVEVSVTAEKLLKPARLGDFRVQVTSPVSLTAEQTESMMRCVHNCLVHNTLLSLPEIKIEIAAGVLQ